MDEVKRVMGLWLLLWVRWEPLKPFEQRRGGIWLCLSSITQPAGLRINCGGTTMDAERSGHWSRDGGYRRWWIREMAVDTVRRGQILHITYRLDHQDLLTGRCEESKNRRDMDDFSKVSELSSHLERRSCHFLRGEIVGGIGWKGGPLQIDFSLVGLGCTLLLCGKMDSDSARLSLQKDMPTGMGGICDRFRIVS